MGNSSFDSPSYGPATQLITLSPGRTLTTSPCNGRVARVNTSTMTPLRSSCSAMFLTYTFIPPASPVPGCSRGEVCMEIIATRIPPKLSQIRAGLGVGGVHKKLLNSTKENEKVR